MHFLYIHIKNSSYDIPWTLLEMKQQVSIYEEYDFDPYAPSQDAFIQLEQYLLSNDCDCLISYLYIPEIINIPIDISVGFLIRRWPPCFIVPSKIHAIIYLFSTKKNTKRCVPGTFDIFTIFQWEQTHLVPVR